MSAVSVTSSGSLIIKDLGGVLGWEPFLWQILFVELQREDKVYCFKYNVLCYNLQCF